MYFYLIRFNFYRARTHAHTHMSSLIYAIKYTEFCVELLSRMYEELAERNNNDPNGNGDQTIAAAIDSTVNMHNRA